MVICFDSEHDGSALLVATLMLFLLVAGVAKEVEDDISFGFPACPSVTLGANKYHCTSFYWIIHSFHLTPFTGILYRFVYI